MFDSWIRKMPWRRKWQSPPAFLPGESHGWRSLIGYTPWGRKESDTTEQLNNKVTETCQVICTYVAVSGEAEHFLTLFSKKVKVKSLSCVQLFVTPWTVAYQAPPSMGFSRQECWSGLPFTSPGDLPNPGIELGSPMLQADALPLSHQQHRAEI